MAVTFTPNIGLAKPDETELGKNWATAIHLAQDNNNILKPKMDLVIQSYTPTFIGPTTNPSVGSGSIVGEYYEFMGFIFGTFVIKCLDPGVAVGSGTGSYGISLPINADSTFHTLGASLNDNPGAANCVGEAYITDASAIATSGTAALDIIVTGGIQYFRPIPEAYTGKTNRFFGPTFPFSLATGDACSGSFLYKKA